MDTQNANLTTVNSRLTEQPLSRACAQLNCASSTDILCAHGSEIPLFIVNATPRPTLPQKFWGLMHVVKKKFFGCSAACERLSKYTAEPRKN